MISAEGEKKIKALLLSKTKVGIEWSDFKITDFNKAFDEALKNGRTYTLYETLKSYDQDLKFVDSSDSKSFENLSNNLAAVRKKINEEAQVVMATLDKIGADDSMITDTYIQIIADSFTDKNKQLCLIIAPHRWLPKLR